MKWHELSKVADILVENKMRKSDTYFNPQKEPCEEDDLGHELFNQSR